MGLRPAASLADFHDAPVGRWVAGDSFMLWAASPTLVGSVYFASPSEAEWRTLLELWDVARHPSLRSPYDCVVDASGVDALPPNAFEALVAHVDFMHAIAGRVRRLGCVRPRGMVGATLTGVFYDRVRTFFEAALFENRAEAFAYLERGDTPPIAQELAVLIDAVRGTPAVLRRLREHLAAHRGITDVDAAADAIGVARRTLQRNLADARTTFRQEAESARIAAAEAMLLDPGLKIDHVARRAGFASASHLARSFRRHTGESPAEFRQRRRSAPRV
jgi:AraC-like DNA-binding protein